MDQIGDKTMKDENKEMFEKMICEALAKYYKDVERFKAINK